MTGHSGANEPYRRISLFDHDTIGAVIANSAYGVRQSNGRYRYGLRFKYNGRTLISVEVYEQRSASGVVNDGKPLGVVTAFCVGHQHCPPGVNESLP
jgi:hypothetical protein